jgi:hypothetical protein
MECLFKDIRSALIPSIPSALVFYIKHQFWKLANRYICAQPIGEIFPIPPLSWGWIADYGVDDEIM